MESSVFHFTVPEASNERLKLTAFDPNKHGDTFFRLSSPQQETYKHMTMKPPNSAEGFKYWFHPDSGHSLSFSNPTTYSFAIIDKTRPPSNEDPEGELAGTVSFTAASLRDLYTEIGTLIILPPYRRTHVASNTVGLALQIALDPPSQGGIGLKRAEWYSGSENLESLRLAERMGFEKVALIPWHIRYIKGKLAGKVGRNPPPGTDPEDLWKDTVIFSLAWDRWEDTARLMTEKAMARES